MSIGGDKPSAPTKPKPTAAEIAQNKVASEKWNSFIDRYLPVEANLRGRIAALDSNASYTRAQAKAAHDASAQMGAASLAGAQEVAAGGSPLALLKAYTGADALSSSGMAQQYAGQRGNFLDQSTGILKMGAGISGQGMGAFKSSADYERGADNRAYAESVSRNLAGASERLGTLTSLGEMAMTMGASKGGITNAKNKATNWLDQNLGTDFGGYDAMNVQSRPSTGGYTGSKW
jgi:hypothetical protein